MLSELADLLNPRQHFLVLVLKCEGAVVAEQYSLSLNAHTYLGLFGLHFAGVRMSFIHSLVFSLRDRAGRNHSPVM